MDAQTLRLILAVVGAVFLIGLYLWEKQRAEGGDAERRPRPRARARRKHEPNLGRLDEDAPMDAPVGAPLGARFPADPDDSRDEPNPFAEPGQTDVGDGPSVGPSAVAPALGEQTSEVLIQLFVTCPDGAFAGAEILDAAEQCRLYPGEMDIFHRTRGDAPDGDPLFSMANLVKPGTFPFDDMDGFSSPGLAVFGQFHGEPSDLMVFDEMLEAAAMTAELLNGDVRGPNREFLRDADAKALREQVLALLNGTPEARGTP